MRRGNVKKISSGSPDKGMVSMFNQMLGAEGADPTIVVPKYVNVKKKVNALSRLLSAAVKDVILKSFPDEKDGCSEIISFVAELDAINFINSDSESKMCDQYDILKKNPTIHRIILTCKTLIDFKDKLSIVDFDDSFIARAPGFELLPFSFSQLNLKRMWAQQHITIRVKKYIFTFLQIALNLSMSVYKTITSPDIDVEKFSQVIIDNLSKLKKVIPRCDKAFDRLEDSLTLLSNNFGTYYKDFIQSQNPSTILESFVIDVSRSVDSDAQTMFQFQKIIKYYKNATQGKIKDPKIKKMFDILNANFSMMGKQN